MEEEKSNEPLDSKAEDPYRISLNDLIKVWELESKEIESFLDGKNPNSILNRINESYVNLARSFGDGTSTGRATFFDNESLLNLIGTLGALTGTSKEIMALVAGSYLVDLPADIKLIKKLELTNTLLSLHGKRADRLNWDQCLIFLDHIQHWMLPIFSIRISSLNEIKSMASSEEIVEQRLGLYSSAIEELTDLVNRFSLTVERWSKSWEDSKQQYLRFEKEMLCSYQEEKQRIKLAHDALLINQTEYLSKSRELEDKLKLNKCGWGPIISNCPHIKLGGSPYCFFHECFVVGCNEATIKDTHYCKSHSGVLTPAPENKNEYDGSWDIGDIYILLGLLLIAALVILSVG